MSGLAWQRNSADDLSGTWSTIESIELVDGDEITLGILESDGRERLARIWVAGFDAKGPTATNNRNGAEIAAEGWLEVSAHGAGVWQTLTFPTSFPAVFLDLGTTHGAYPVTIGASARTLLDFRFNVPVGASSSGVVRWMPVLRCVDA